MRAALLSMLLGNNFFQQPQHPYTEKLFEVVPSIQKRTEKLSVIPGQVPRLLHLPVGCRFQNRCPYAWELCREKEPELLETDKKHAVRCWRYTDKAEFISVDTVLEKKLPLRTISEEEKLRLKCDQKFIFRFIVVY